MTVIKQQKSLLFGPECLPSKYYIELIRILNLTIISASHGSLWYLLCRFISYFNFQRLINNHVLFESDHACYRYVDDTD